MLEYKNHSASSINEFISNKPLWFAKKFKGFKTKPGLPLIRGSAVEEGMNFYVLKKRETTMEECIKAALKTYDEKLAGIDDDIDFRQSIGPMVIKGCEEISKIIDREKSFPKLQQKINIWLDGCKYPLIGYLDYQFPTLIVDNKTTGRTPSELSVNYIIQGSIYRHATNCPVEFLFEVATKEVKTKLIRLSEYDFELGRKYATAAAQAIERIVDNPIDGGLMEAFMFPDLEAGYNKSEQSDLAKLYGVL